METKTCWRCQRELPLTAFAWKNKAKGTYQSHCRDCQKEYRREHYAKNRDRYIAMANDRKQEQWDERRNWLIEYLDTHPCVDCGESDIIVLEFDHVRGEKRFNIGRDLNYYGWATLMEEVAKCDVRCANCHRRATARRAGTFRTILADEV